MSCESLRDVDKEAELYLHLKLGQNFAAVMKKVTRRKRLLILAYKDHMEMGDEEVGDMDDESGTSTPKKVVIDTLNKYSDISISLQLQLLDLVRDIYRMESERSDRLKPQ